jgi:cytochrome c5
MRNCVPVVLVLCLLALMVLAGCPGKPKPESVTPGQPPIPVTAPPTAAPAASNAAPAAAVPAGDAKALFETKCSRCHKLEVATSKKMDQAGWAETVKDMASKKAGWISDAEANTITQYLAATCPM